MPQESAMPDLAKVVTGLFDVADRGDWDAVLSAYAPWAVLETADGVFDAVSPERISTRPAEPPNGSPRSGG
jgi:hypothetical protein